MYYIYFLSLFVANVIHNVYLVAAVAAWIHLRHRRACLGDSTKSVTVIMLTVVSDNLRRDSFLGNTRDLDMNLVKRPHI